MKTNIKAAQILTAKSVQIKSTRARARARDEAKQDATQARLAARDMIQRAPLPGRGELLPAPNGAPCMMTSEELRAIGAGLLTLREVETIHAEQAREASEARERAELLQAREAWRVSDYSAHVKAWEACNQAREDAARARRYEAARESGAWDAVAMAPLGGDLPRGAREAMAKLGEAGARIIGDGWHASEADAAKRKLDAMRAAEVRAGASRLLALGDHGRASARGARIADSSGMRWLRRNSRREALALCEVGGAAGVDDMQAGQDWARELIGISRAVHAGAVSAGMFALDCAAMIRAAGGGRMSFAASPATAADWIRRPDCGRHGMPAACAAILKRIHALASMPALRARRAMFGRGVRPVGKPLVIWTAAGRQLAPESFGIQGRGRAWRRASQLAARAMHSARYGLNGRDGREVWADWSVVGNIAPRAERVIARKSSEVREIRDELAACIVSARAAVSRKRAAAMLAITAAERVKAGGELGKAKQSLAAARERARVLRAVLAADLAPELVADYFETSRAISAAGRKFAERARKFLPVTARKISRESAIA